MRFVISRVSLYGSFVTSRGYALTEGSLYRLWGSLFREVRYFAKFMISRASLYREVREPRGSLYQEVRYIGKFIISRGSLYLELCYIGKFVTRFVISRGSLYREVRYVGRFAISRGSLYRKVHYIARFVFTIAIQANEGIWMHCWEIVGSNKAITSASRIQTFVSLCLSLYSEISTISSVDGFVKSEGINNCLTHVNNFATCARVLVKVFATKLNIYIFPFYHACVENLLRPFCFPALKNS